MSNFNALAALVDSLKVFPEPVSFPERLEDRPIVELAEARNRFQQIAQCATELRKLIDSELADRLDGEALRYGDDVYRKANRGRARVVNPELWWEMVEKAVHNAEDPPALLAALYPTDAVRLGALPKLAEVLRVDADTLKSTMIDYAEPTAILSVMPLSKAPKWTHDLAEGEVSGGQVS